MCDAANANLAAVKCRGVNEPVYDLETKHRTQRVNSFSKATQLYNLKLNGRNFLSILWDQNFLVPLPVVCTLAVHLSVFPVATTEINEVDNILAGGRLRYRYTS